MGDRGRVKTSNAMPRQQPEAGTGRGFCLECALAISSVARNAKKHFDVDGLTVAGDATR
jgi:hypothetical protein